MPTGDGSAHPLQDAERLLRFRREFRSLLGVNQPNLVGLHTLEVEGNQWFFTMDLVEGVDFLAYVRGAQKVFPRIDPCDSVRVREDP